MTRPALLWIVATLTMAPATAMPILNLFPNNDLTPPLPLVLRGNGSAVGVGFSLQNDNSGYLVVTGVTITDPSPAGPVTAWVDLLSPTIASSLAPNDLLSASWVPGTSGLGEVTFDAALTGFTGPVVTITLAYDLYDADPFTAPTYNQLPSGTIDTLVEFDVSDPSSLDTPEPSTLALMGTALLVLLAISMRRQPGAAVRN